MKQKLLSFFLVSLALLGSLYAQERTIRGKVTAKDSGEPLPGVSVMAVGTSSGSTTNEEGIYSISVPANAKALIFSYIGFEKETVSIGNQTVIDVELSQDAQALSEVVVTALGIERKRNELGYAAQEVRSEDITRTRDNNFTNALSGKVAGLDIKQSGTMGGSTNVVMRGYKSLTGNNQALFVIDGVPVSNVNTNTDLQEDADAQNQGRGGYDYGNAAADINPDDIESINVLKGAAASALYGSRASNGVIMITTKKGKKNSTNITINSGLTIGKIDKSTFAKYQKEYGAGYVNQYSEEGYASPDGNFWYETVFGNSGPALVVPFTEDASYGAAFDPNLLVYQWDAFDETSPNYGKATPWVGAQNDPSKFYKTGLNSMQSISIDGGGDVTTYKVGYTRNDETGVLPNSKITKNMFNLSGSHQINDKLTVSATANFSRVDAIGRYGTGYDGRNPNQGFRQWWQTNVDIRELERAYEREGRNVTWNWSDIDATGPIYSNNPYWERYKNYQNDSRNRYFGSAVVNWKPLEWMDVMGRVTFDGSNEFQEERLAIGGAEVPEYQRYDRTYSEANYDLMLNFHKDLAEDLTFTGLLGSNLRRNYLSAIRAQTNGGLAYEGIYSLSNSIFPIEPPKERYERIGVDGIFANANFGYKETYFIEGSIRRDQSTTLPTDNNVYWYPSVAGSFLFSNLLKDSNWLDYGKLRVNYAEVGNDASALSLYNTYTINTPFNGIPMASIAEELRNSNLKPERTKSFEVGLEMNFWDSRVGFDASYYRSTSFDQIMAVTVSSATGYDRRWVNAGSLRNQGFELSAFVIPVRTNDFSWTLNLNFARNRNKMIELYEGNNNLQLGTFQGGITLNATLDQPFGTLRGVDYLYLDGHHGDPDYRIVGEDGYYLTSSPDQVLGNINPDWLGGIQNNFKYKDFSLSFLIDIKKGGSLFSLDQYYGMSTGIYPETAGLNDLGNPKRLPISQGGGVVLPGVNPDGSPNATRVEAYDNSVTPYGYANNPQAGFIYDAGYIKLREVSLTYSLPNRWLANTNFFKGIDFSLVGRNLWLIHSNVPYADPEGGLSSGNLQGIQSGVYPAVRNFGFNVRMRF
ncbi:MULTISPECIES: SusC/RagA family TonB-linked outer membrane protein [Olivibacter]|jgi:TonB-linked SusC/RagA family outer membrane protein|uniref:SusC/RagA family TonB-linked outer membrane protein n=2 Tax=Olivibacter TaxID=376469 RepID=A0ABV6HF13_9SPHI|nr:MULTISPECIES: SusC/RagA family TonB-linked outer membrane protein [Olivibacter]MCL4640933.1 SusC/RagA family TonB-linked outer membrane protein [Olivibacter sp. UJ_SKK_5.1]MDX3911967.1 SusC/RagA family TonB-linked outer membrane protein [Pseudosphingobacterium sp.]QEK99711.1 SusC/RagA family TonB-linked outer membrane protein [Olivibacter sp. LS-1]